MKECYLSKDGLSALYNVLSGPMTYLEQRPHGPRPPFFDCGIQEVEFLSI